MGDERQLARRAVAAGLLDDDAGPPPAPAKYDLVRCLGEGGAGTVWLATDRDLRRPVALKFLRDARAADLERFVREARFAARLATAGIVAVHETGEADGVPFIAMQYVAGGNLATVELDVAATIRVAREVAEALLHAHEAGIVHRDIKPENVLLDERGRAWVTDFGIARDLRGELGATISQLGQVMGTPALMPPEQARGDIHNVDERSDVYALGATLYSKLTGRRPFTGANVVEVLHAVLHEDAPLPRSFNASIPRDLEAVVLRCMRKVRAQRFGSMREVVEALDACARGMGAEQAAASPWFAWYVRKSVPNAPSAVDETAGGETEDLGAAMQAAREIAAWDTDLYRVGANLPRRFPKLDALIARLDGVLTERPGAGWARYYRGIARFRRGDLEGALEDVERAIGRVQDASGAHFELGRLYLALYLRDHRRAHRHLVRGGTEHDLKTARSRLEQAALAFEEARRLRHDLPESQAGYVEAVQRLAEEDYEGCVARCDAVLAEDPDLEEVWKLRGDALRLAGRDPTESYERALEVRRSYFEALLAGAEHRLDRDDRARARAWLERALRVHPGLAAARVLMARTWLGGDADDRARGLAHARQALRDDPGSYGAAMTIAELSLEGGAFDETFAALARAAQLPGCQNRVQYTRARTHLARGRARAAAADPQARLDFERVLELNCPTGGALWEELAAEARAALR